MLRALSDGHQRQVEGLDALHQPLADPVDHGPQDDGVCAEGQVRTVYRLGSRWSYVTELTAQKRARWYL